MVLRNRKPEDFAAKYSVAPIKQIVAMRVSA